MCTLAVRERNIGNVTEGSLNPMGFTFFHKLRQQITYVKDRPEEIEKGVSFSTSYANYALAIRPPNTYLGTRIKKHQSREIFPASEHGEKAELLIMGLHSSFLSQSSSNKSLKLVSIKKLAETKLHFSSLEGRLNTLPLD